MNGAQDLGGMMGFGPVAPEPDEPLFHATWEQRAPSASRIACGATGRVEHRREPRTPARSLPPAEYLASSYYEIWIKALADVARAAVSSERTSSRPGHALRPLRDRAPARWRPGSAGHAGARRALRQARRPAGPLRGGRARAGPQHQPRPATAAAALCARQGGRGRDASLAASSSPTATRTARGENPQWCLHRALRRARALGRGRRSDADRHVDCWEPYLEPAP